MLDGYFNLKYYKIDDSLPDLEFKEGNCGVDLYVREDTLVPPNLGLVQLIDQQNNIIIPGKDGKPKGMLTVGQVMPATYIPMNVIFKGNEYVNYLLFMRSSSSDSNFYLANHVGVIDPSYEGVNDEIRAKVINLSPIPVLVEKGERLCQMLFMQRAFPKLKKARQHWGSSDRGGFGSTGK